VNTIAKEPFKSRRLRRKHGAEFKAQVVAACRPVGVSIAAIAMANGVNANLLRRW
jgi:transposase